MKELFPWNHFTVLHTELWEYSELSPHWVWICTATAHKDLMSHQLLIGLTLLSVTFSHAWKITFFLVTKVQTGSYKFPQTWEGYQRDNRLTCHCPKLPQSSHGSSNAPAAGTMASSSRRKATQSAVRSWAATAGSAISSRSGAGSRPSSEIWRKPRMRLRVKSSDPVTTPGVSAGWNRRLRGRMEAPVS